MLVVVALAGTVKAESANHAEGLRAPQYFAEGAQQLLVVPRLLGGGLGGPRAELVVVRVDAHLMQALRASGPARLAWRRVAQVASTLGDRTTLMQALEQQAEMALVLSDYDDSQKLAHTLLFTARQAGSADFESAAHGYIAVLARRRGDLDTALEQNMLAMRLLGEEGSAFRRALMLTNLGTVYRDRGDFARALELQLQALEIRERIGDAQETSLRNIALLYREIEDEAMSRKYFQRALESVNRQISPETYAPILGSYASLLNDVGDHDVALAAANEALGIDVALGNRAKQGLELLEAGRAQFGLGQTVEAAELLESALEIGRELNQREIVARSLLHLAEINQSQSNSLRARGMIDEAISGLEAAMLRPQLVQAYSVREKIALAEHDFAAALRYLRRHGEQRELLLGTRASRQLSDLKTRHARAESEKDLALLQKGNELQAERLGKQEIQRHMGMVVLAGLCLALLLVIWRFRGVNRLNNALLLKGEQLDAKSRALASANRQLEERATALYQASIRDSLTGVFNRGHLRERLERKLHVCLDRHRPLAVLMIDFDSFKLVNDQLGHLFGDRVLVAGVAAIRSQLADGDLLGRFGGEEFVVLLEGERAEDAEDIADSIRSQVQSSLAGMDTRGIIVTVSIGLARLADLSGNPQPGVDSLLDAGDQAMYAAKAAGRNRVATLSRISGPVESFIHG
ncbi:diguanylate cyclase [Dokdonella sp.]|uniref:diguanylate cyclase n=1 Tax=Dokdonella sp. TaxID=2291710 RepID=UPI003C4938BA